jgi:hypothetical protein
MALTPTPTLPMISSLFRIKQRHVLVEQHGRLLERIAQQRAALQVQWEPIHQVALKGDRALAAAGRLQQYIQAHRRTFTLALSVACVALVVVRPVRSLRWLKNGFVLWRGWRALQAAQSLVPGSLLSTAFGLISRRFFRTGLK